jgi:monothiol glutaredoxin
VSKKPIHHDAVVDQEEKPMWDRDSVARLVAERPIVIFGKGTRTRPQCGFTARAIQVMEAIGRPFEVIDIFADPAIKPALVEYTNWPTTPQVFIGGEFIGGSDIVLELHERGELEPKVEAAVAG